MSILGPDCADARPAARALSQKLSACAGRQDDRLLRRRLQPRVLSEAVWCKSSLRCRACDENCRFTFSLSRCRAQTRYLDALRKRDVYIRGLPIVTYYTPYRKHEETNSPAFAQRPALCICIFKLSSPAPGSSSARHRRPCIGYTASPWYKLCRTRLQRTSSRLPHLSFSCPSRLLGFTRNDM